MNDPRTRSALFWLALLALAAVVVHAYTGRVSEQLRLDGALRGGFGARIDLNAAPRAEIEALPGVGPEKARAIVEFRERRGRIERIEDLLDAPGIGPTTLETIRPFVSVDAGDGVHEDVSTEAAEGR